MTVPWSYGGMAAFRFRGYIYPSLDLITISCDALLEQLHEQLREQLHGYGI